MITVGMPLYRSDDIAWLAMESLCRQESPGAPWELVVAEERERAFGEDRIREYWPRLEEAGCTNIVYLSVKDWVCLSQKWQMIVNLAHKDSKVLMLQAGDCYSYPWRLADSWNAIWRDGNHWFHNLCWRMYDIVTGRCMDFAWDQKRSKTGPIATTPGR